MPQPHDPAPASPLTLTLADFLQASGGAIAVSPRVFRRMFGVSPSKFDLERKTGRLRVSQRGRRLFVAAPDAIAWISEGQEVANGTP